MWVPKSKFLSVKRLLDILSSSIFMLLASPILFLTVLLIRLQDGGPIFFRQIRLGKNGTSISLLKFRSMTVRPDRKPEEYSELLDGTNPEITPVGRVIRRFKIDELPQLLSVFRGDLSLVGPRPCLPEQQGEFDENGRKRLLARPGCTGLAQTHGNIHLEWSERWKYDAWYVDHLSFSLDVWIVARTFAMILLGEKRFKKSFSEFQCQHGDDHE